MVRSALKFKSIGRNVQISPHANFYNSENIEIGDNVRIDDFCILSAGAGGIKIGSNIHIAPYCSLIGAGRIILEDYAQVAARCSILSSSDSFDGDSLVGPCVPMEKRNVTTAEVTLKPFAVLGIGCVVLPGATIGYNSSIGAMSLIKGDVPAGGLFAGNPLRLIRKREFVSEHVFEAQREWYK